MSTFSKVVPGKVNNEGITSGETFPTVSPLVTSPAHYPDFAAVTPKGPLERKNVSLSDFETLYGKVSDPYGNYYNPVTLAINLLGKSGQSSLGFKRLTNNKVYARAVLGVLVFPSDKVPFYKRDAYGDYQTDLNGKLIPDGEGKGNFVVPTYLTVKTKANEIGKLKQVKLKLPEDVGSLTKETEGTFYPFAEFKSGIGEEYNRSYFNIGHGTDVDWSEIARFVLTNGSYPFDMKIGTVTDSGLYVESQKINGGVVSNFTLFKTREKETGITYSLKSCIGNYTGSNVNRPIELTPAPFEDVYTYDNQIQAVCDILYKSEYVDGGETPPNVRSNTLPKYAVMNPIDLVNHLGKPYKTIVKLPPFSVDSDPYIYVASPINNLNQAFLATGGLDPFVDEDGKYVAKPKDWLDEVDGTWVEAKGDVKPSIKQYWQMNQALLYAYYLDYLNGKEFRDVIRNRTSFIWDVGYNQEVKDVIIQAMVNRKDFLSVPCCTKYLRNLSPEQTYAVASSLNSKATLIPESAQNGTPALRCAINLWDGRYIDESTFERFSLNIDLMCAFAACGGSEDGRISVADLPTEGNNALLRYAFDPNIDFEDDDPAAQNLINGSITLRPANMTQWKRPALPTVYTTTDSVLKDLVNPWYGVVIEKILQDQWILVSGSEMSAANYLATVKDNATKQIHSQLGACLSSFTVETWFPEDAPNSRSRMRTKVIYWVGKAKYMMDAVLEARNEQELTTTS